MLRIRKSRKLGRIPWKKVAQTFTLFPAFPRSSSSLSSEEALAKDWEVVMNDMAIVMGDLASAWQVFEGNLDAEQSRAK